MSTHSNEGDTTHIIPDWESACKKAETEARRAQAGWVKEIENHRRTTLKLIEAMK